LNDGAVTHKTRDLDYRDEVHILNEGIDSLYLPSAKRDSILRWARGYDEKDENDDSNTTDIRAYVGDPLHSSPAAVNYQTGPVVYFATNQGYLHAIDGTDGREVFSFIPKELLGNLTSLYDNEESSNHTYGLDGHITVWHDEQGAVKNGVVDGTEKVYLYVGMRRGGRNYYAFDVTDPNNPKFIWQVEGGSPDFLKLGQTWSKPIKAQVMFDSVLRDVLIFGGGYNPNQDQENGTGRRVDDYGNTVYMIDAKTGQKIWHAAPIQKWDDMEYSIPSDIRVLDTDGNGLADRMYAGDMGGQVWRFDIKQHHSASDTYADFINGGVLADVGGQSNGNSIRFYNQPDVALINQQGERFFSVSIGSGWRAHPLDDVVNDRFYMIRDNSPFNVTGNYGLRDGSTYRAIRDADLVDITTSGGKFLSDIPHGWYLRMEDPGEKVLGKSITINNQVIFTSYTPGAAASACEPAVGKSTAYVASITNGDPIFVGGRAPTESNMNTSFDKENRKIPLKIKGIAPSPSAIISAHGNAVLATVLIGTEELVGINFSALTRRTYWQDKLRGPKSPAEIAAE
jgi:type IV pilus assembly protein PilY1